MARLRQLMPELRISNLKDSVPNPPIGRFRSVGGGHAKSRAAGLVQCPLKGLGCVKTPLVMRIGGLWQRLTQCIDYSGVFRLATRV